MIVATICGGAESVWSDFEAARDLVLPLLEPGDRLYRLAVNEAGIEHPGRLDHWCTLHPDKMRNWLKARLAADRNRPKMWGVTMRDDIDEVQRVWRGGSSGLHAVDVAIHKLGADAVLLCGIPMDDGRNRFHGRDWGEYTRYWPEWFVGKKPRSGKPLPELEGVVRSFGGRTADLLGFPDTAWLEEVRCRTT